MAIKKTLTGAVPSVLDGKVVRWSLTMKYEQKYQARMLLNFMGLLREIWCLARLFSKHPVMGKYIHLPVQSGSDSILLSMKRKVTKSPVLKQPASNLSESVVTDSINDI